MKEPVPAPASLTDFEFRSRLPIFGSLVSGFRQVWHGVAGRWALRWFAQQQDQINRQAAGALNDQAEKLGRQQAELRHQQELLAVQSLALADQIALVGKLSSVSADLASRILEIEHRQSEMGVLLAGAEQRLVALANALSAQNDVLTREARDRSAELTSRVQRLEAATQAYLEELGHEMADLAIRVGELGPNGESLRPGGA